MLYTSVSQLTDEDLRVLHDCAQRSFGLPSPFTERDLKRAYHRAALQAHPDHGGDAETFDALQRVVGYLKLLVDQDVPTILAARAQEQERLRAQAMLHALRLQLLLMDTPCAPARRRAPPSLWDRLRSAFR